MAAPTGCSRDTRCIRRAVYPHAAARTKPLTRHGSMRTSPPTDSHLLGRVSTLSTSLFPTSIIYILSDCQKTSLKTCAIEQRGVCAGGKKPTARSIKQDFETFLKVSKSAQRGEKTFSTRCIFIFFIISTVLTYSKARKPLQILGSREYRGGKILCTHSVLTRWKSPVIVDFHVLVEGFFAHGAVLGDGDLRERAALKGAGVDFRYGFGDHHAFQVFAA